MGKPKDPKGIALWKKKISEALRGEKNPNWKPKIKTKCASCGAVLYVYPHSFRNSKRFFCDQKCSHAWQRGHFKGKNNPNWGNHLSRESKDKISEANTGKISWNKGLTKRTDKRMEEAAKANGEAVKKKWMEPEYKKKQKKRWDNPQYCELISSTMSRTNRKRWLDPVYRRNYEEMMKKFWADSTYRERTLKSMVKASQIKPNKSELKLFSLLQKVLPGQYAINVKAEVMVLGGKIPDFVNIDGRKAVVEFWGDYWHAGQNPQDRIDYFKQFGYSTLIIWEHELKNEICLIERIKRFSNKK